MHVPSRTFVDPEHQLLRAIIYHKSLSQLRNKLWLVACAVCLANIALLQTARAQDADAPTLLILFDASGSMWGKMPKGANAKFESARTAINKSLIKTDKALKSGLIVLGGSCSGVTTPVPPTLQSLSKISTALNQLNPRSKGPISLSLRTAKDVLEPKTGAAVLLIHDGSDNCGQDPCAAAADFAKAHKGVPVNLISIDNSRADASAMRCVAKKTGGKVFIANSIDQISTAMTKVIAALEIERPVAAVPKLAPARKKGRRAKPNIDPNGPPHLSLYATLTKDSADVTTPLRWRVFKDGETDRPLLDVVEQSFTTQLPEGKYLVTADLGLAKNTQTISVAAKGETVVTMPLEAGSVTFPATAASADLTTSTQTNTVPTFLTLKALTNSQANTPSHSTPILLDTRADNHLTLPAGKFEATLEHGASKTTKVITVAAGKSQVIDIKFETGELRLKATTNENEHLHLAPLFKVYVDDPDAPGGRRELARSAAQNPVFALPAGTYYITVQSGHAKKSANVALSAGDTIQKVLSLDLARLRIRYSLEIDANTASLPVQYTLLRITGSNEEVVTTTGEREPLFDLPPGKYGIIAEIGARNVIAKSEIELPAGANEVLTISAAAGEVGLKLSGEASALTIDRFWEVRDKENNVVWRTNQYAPKALLAPGQYIVKCETRAGLIQKEFELASGDRQIIELDLP